MSHYPPRCSTHGKIHPKTKQGLLCRVISSPFWARPSVSRIRWIINEADTAAWFYQTEHGHPPSSVDALEEMESTANELLAKAQVKQKVCTVVQREIVQWVSMYCLPFYPC